MRFAGVRVPAENRLAQANSFKDVGRVLTKLDLRDRVQAVVLAYETGLVVPSAPEEQRR